MTTSASRQRAQTSRKLYSGYYCLPFFELQDGHLYCLIISALAGVIFTHLPWYQRSQTSHPIQNSSAL
uniref:Phd/F-box containing protein n=1 Tax=Rhizophora mucronata TaxID=61149 RepID=A0A2P2IX55_RHIMU